MFLFLDAGQADLAVLICPRNYVHSGGVWNLFDIARQVLRAFIHVTELPEPKAKQLALIGCTQEVFLNGRWMRWGTEARREFQNRAAAHFQNS
jgi:hypothetical protein